MSRIRILAWILGLVGVACLAGALVITIAPKEPTSATGADITATTKAVTAPNALAGWAWRSADAQGTWQNGGYYIQNDAWNGSHGPQTIYANSFHEIKVISDQPTGNTEIMTYPDVSGLYTGSDTPVSQFSSIYNTFSE